MIGKPNFYFRKISQNCDLERFNMYFMFRSILPRVIFSCLFFLLVFSDLESQKTMKSARLLAPVDILTDIWGIPHIYAANEHDLFFAQGYYAAKDRLFQFEIWRRQATGTVAELLGERELKRDIGTRLFKFRGDIEQEMNHYHPRGAEIIRAYVEGVNAYIEHILLRPEELPIEFKLLKTLPQKWTPEVVISRHQGLLGNISDELNTARAVHLLGEKRVKELNWFHPKDPDLRIDPKIDASLLMEDILELYNAYRRSLSFQPEDLMASVRNENNYRNLADLSGYEEDMLKAEERNIIGSNNWVIAPEKTESGHTIMANDPHRRQSVPSLRYMAHLVAPGWDVIGGGEPEIPGISIGHNPYGSWGLTVFETDAEDLYVYQLNPENPHEYLYKNQWKKMDSIRDTIHVKGKKDFITNHFYTLHGPVLHIDNKNHVAYAMRCAWLETGGSPYLASLRMNQAQNWDEFREACNYSHIPGENMVWADKKGNIGWQSVGIAPIRRNFSGMVPVPGDGRYEWEGYLPILAKPHAFNPESGYINTSNENVTPNDYALWDAIGYSWTDPYRGDRVAEFIEGGRKMALSDMMQLQTDYLSIPARQICPLVLKLSFDEDKYSEAQAYLKNWNYELSPESIAAGIYNSFETELKTEIEKLMVPEMARRYVFIQMKRIIEWLYSPGIKFGRDPMKGRDSFLREVFMKAVDKLERKLGNNILHWQYGQEKYKHIYLRHPMSDAVNDSLRAVLDVGPFPRGGNSYTVNNTSGADNQISGASFRVICDSGNWDSCVASNNPGQNGNPDHPHYKNLFEIWANDQFFPLFYSREKVESVLAEKWILLPK